MYKSDSKEGLLLIQVSPLLCTESQARTIRAVMLGQGFRASPRLTGNGWVQFERRDSAAGQTAQRNILKMLDCLVTLA